MKTSKNVLSQLKSKCLKYNDNIDKTLRVLLLVKDPCLFIRVSRESVNLIGYITVFYLLIENSFKRDCTRGPFSTRISTHRAPRLNQ